MQNRKQLIAYIIIACIGVSLNLGFSRFFELGLGMGYSSSVALGYFIGMIWTFITTKYFAFGASKSGNMTREAIKFFAVSGFALGVTTLTSTLFLFILHIGEDYFPAFQAWCNDILAIFYLSFVDKRFIANILGIACGLPFNFLGHKHITYRTTGYYNRLRKKA